MFAACRLLRLEPAQGQGAGGRAIADIDGLGAGREVQLEAVAPHLICLSFAPGNIGSGLVGYRGEGEIAAVQIKGAAARFDQVNADRASEHAGGEVDLKLKVQVTLSGLVAMAPGVGIKAGHDVWLLF